MAEIEIPEYFLCPISLQMMKEPVTAITGITYERESIEQWLMKAKDCVCPVTKQPLPRSSQYLTPNHTLRRLIQAWSDANIINGGGGVHEQVPANPIPALEKVHYVEKLVKDLKVPRRNERALEKLHGFAMESERNRTCIAEAGVANAMVMLINQSFKQGKTMMCLEEALTILHVTWNIPCRTNMKALVGENLDFINSLTWILNNNNNVKIVNQAMPLLKLTIENTNPTILGNLNFEFFKEMVRVLGKRAISQQALKSTLQILMETCPVGKNRKRIAESGAITELIELELEKPEKNFSELIFNLLAHLCSCAEGREMFLKHAAAIAMVSKRILRVSSATDDRAVHILLMIGKYSGSNDIVLEMLRVGAVSKLCMVMQADCASYLKEKAREILRLHSKVWSNSPCIQVYLLTRYQR
ncbi:hypothetical protein PIB30_068089 [Stylosanthes scabra]|uniref:U-box domain-containing protein n=1 Tax=Stylosanthes scabra TaxID=79078 RepID=A0ABU6SPP5_9FABA|nr:hypothetical protein [Stylosanthes scabra]